MCLCGCVSHHRGHHGPRQSGQVHVALYGMQRRGEETRGRGEGGKRGKGGEVKGGRGGRGEEGEGGGGEGREMKGGRG